MTDDREPGAGAAGRVFPRVFGRTLPIVERGEGSTLHAADGHAYLDAAGGAVVVNVGHGRRSVADAMAAQAARVAYAHGTAFTSDPLEAYAAEVGEVLPLDAPAVYPVSGGSEAIETALKMTRAYHLARGEAGRQIVIARWGSYHGNSLGALDLSGRQPLRRPYEAWLGRFRHVSAAYPYRAGEPRSNALGDVVELASELERMIVAAGPGTVAAFVAEPIVGATLGAVVPPDGYWPAIVEVCRRHGVLVVVDEVMTGFGRTGRWFGVDHWGIRPDLLVAAKGATSGYWPFGFVAAAGPIYEAIAGRASFTASRSATRSRARPWPARSCGSCARRTSSRPPRPRASDSWRCWPSAWRTIRTSARSGVAVSWWAWRSSRTGRPGRRSREPSDGPRRWSSLRANGACSSTREPATRTASTAT